MADLTLYSNYDLSNCQESSVKPWLNWMGRKGLNGAMSVVNGVTGPWIEPALFCTIHKKFYQSKKDNFYPG